MTGLRIGSLFSGYGGLDLAALQLFPGSSVAWHCEWEEAPSAILDHHWPGVPNLHDVTAVDWDAVEPVDILTGGYPCQPFSAAGRRKGTTDERHLWPYVREAIRRLRPRFTLLENVAGHRSMGFDRVLGDCAEDGLHVRWTSVRASDVGACHRRERLFILITTADADCDAIRLESVAQSGSCSPSKSRRTRATATHPTCLGRSEGWLEPARLVGRSDASQCGSADGEVVLLPTPSTADGMGGHLNRSGARSNELLLPGVAKAYGEGKLLPTPTSRDHKGAANAPGRLREGRLRTPGDDTLPDALNRNWGPYGPAIARQQGFSRPAPSPTEPGSTGKPRLAATFAEWMMFLPAGHVTATAIGLSRNDQLKAIGNGVVPPQCAAAFRQLLAWELVNP